MCLPGPPGSTVAGRDGEDGTNNNRGSAPCGNGASGEPVHCTIYRLGFGRHLQALSVAAFYQDNTCLQLAMLAGLVQACVVNPDCLQMPSLLFMYTSACMSISESVLQAMLTWDSGALGAVTC